MPPHHRYHRSDSRTADGRRPGPADAAVAGPAHRAPARGGGDAARAVDLPVPPPRRSALRLAAGLGAAATAGAALTLLLGGHATHG
jgi:hypothetical protein